MTWHELSTALEHADPASEVLVVLYQLNGTSRVFAVAEAQETRGYVKLDIYEDEPAYEEHPEG
ncbi:MAG: hypothetical protein M3255_08740 [Pseudomonadota bacterium]|nr:hypothetical protein [Pseudomonadota bacterium]